MRNRFNIDKRAEVIATRDRYENGADEDHRCDDTYDNTRLSLVVRLRGCKCLDAGVLCENCHESYELVEQYEAEAGHSLRHPEGSLADNFLMLRGLVGDLRRGFSRAVDPERWVSDTQAFIDKLQRQAQSANVSAPIRETSDREGVTLPVGEKQASMCPHGRYGRCDACLANSETPRQEVERVRESAAKTIGELRTEIAELKVRNADLQDVIDRCKG